MGKDHCVHIMLSEFGALCTGVTGALMGRLPGHKRKLTPGL